MSIWREVWSKWLFLVFMFLCGVRSVVHKTPVESSTTNKNIQII